MRLTFQIRYHTHVGQDIFLTGPHEIFGGGNPERAIPLEYQGLGIWRVTVVLPFQHIPTQPLEYGYFVRQPDRSIEMDWPKGRRLRLDELGDREVVINDWWNAPSDPANVSLTEPFQHVLLSKSEPEAHLPTATDTHRFQTYAPLLNADQTLCLVGNCPELGDWNPSQALVLSRQANSPGFCLDLNLSAHRRTVEYKYGRRNSRTGEFEFEAGPNRQAPPPRSPTEIVIQQDGFPRLSFTTWKGAGVAIPVFSLRSQGSFGIGDFGDLKLLADWATKAGLRMIQILPVNDTTASSTWTDSYPYAAISAFALHPIYLDFRQVTESAMRQEFAGHELLRQALNALPSLDYERVLAAKRKLAQSWFTLAHQKVFRTRAFRDFFKANRDWLEPYSAFCALRDRFGTAEFTRWPEYQRFDPTLVAEMSKPTHPDYLSLAYSWFVQYQLHCQLESAAKHAHRLGLILKGDIAIGVNRYGADTWQAPELYRIQMQAGAPPDAFAVKGQNWGFPTYNWSRMQQDHFAWWHRRFEQMGRYFDAFRIDHILGFFRIWSIPLSALEGILGYFVPAIPVTESEFANWGIAFDRTRFLHPWIDEPELATAFGPLAHKARTLFLTEGPTGRLSLRPEFSTQRQVEQHFAGAPATEESLRLQQGLFDLISNVILLQPEGDKAEGYHFRIDMRGTSSFQQLPAPLRERISALYDDYFFRRQESFWRAEGLRKLPALKQATDMLVCGEDLGMVPACVPEVMRQLGLLGLEVQRMPKTLGQDFSHPKEAPYLAVVTPSTHDMSPVRQWWQEDAGVTQHFFNQELGQIGSAPAECTAEIARAIVSQHLESPAMWSVFQLQDLLALSQNLRHPDPAAERINVPAIPRYYWRYRMHFELEKLQAAESFNQTLRELLAQNGRLPTAQSS